jgi:F420-dependent oxidoreductase-like protein
LKVGLSLGHAGPELSIQEIVTLAQEADSLGYDSVWVAEAWGSDAVTPLAWIGATTKRIKLGTAVMQVPARTPTNAAMTAATLDLLSEGRFNLGLGNSGPQVVEGWHGQRWGRPVEKLREYVEIIRSALRGERVEHRGMHFDLPLSDGTGLGKPLRLSVSPLRPELPIYLAAIAPKAVELAFEIGDGWLPIFWSPEQARALFPVDSAREGFEIAPTVRVAIDDDPAAALERLKPYYAFYIGGMGASSKNFYNDLFSSFGYESEAAEIQRLFQKGNREQAAAAVPNAFVDEVALAGPPERIKERLAVWERSGATTALLAIRDLATLRAVAEIAF